MPTRNPICGVNTPSDGCILTIFMVAFFAATICFAMRLNGRAVGDDGKGLRGGFTLLVEPEF